MTLILPSKLSLDSKSPFAMAMSGVGSSIHESDHVYETRNDFVEVSKNKYADWQPNLVTRGLGNKFRPSLPHWVRHGMYSDHIRDADKKAGSGGSPVEGHQYCILLDFGNC